MRLNKYALLGSAAVVAVMAASPASAFNKVDWRWDLDIHENVWKNIWIDVDVDPDGVLLLQFAQVQVGDVNAYALMTNVHNNPPTEVEFIEADFTGTGTASGSLDVTGTAEGFVDIDSTGNAGTDPDQQVINGYIGIAGNPTGNSTSDGGIGLVDGALGDEDPLTVDGTASGELDVVVSGTILAPVAVPLDAADLPKFENIATAVGNNASLESTTMIEFHGGQFLFDDCNDCADGGSLPPIGVETASVGGGSNSTNPYSEVGLAITLGAILGVVDQADVTATAYMNNVSQGQMENAATAVGNNFSATLETEIADNGVIMGDLTQVSVANVSADAQMYDVAVSNYNNLGVLDGPLFSNVATAVGNNLSVSLNNVGGDLVNGGGEGTE